MRLWAWLLLAVGIAAVVGGLALRSQLRFAMKLARALPTDTALAV